MKSIQPNQKGLHTTTTTTTTTTSATTTTTAAATTTTATTTTTTINRNLGHFGITQKVTGKGEEGLAQAH